MVSSCKSEKVEGDSATGAASKPLSTRAPGLAPVAESPSTFSLLQDETMPPPPLPGARVESGLLAARIAVDALSAIISAARLESLPAANAARPR
jgi:hypothetical protein